MTALAAEPSAEAKPYDPALVAKCATRREGRRQELIRDLRGTGVHVPDNVAMQLCSPGCGKFFLVHPASRCGCS
jgi:uncharacterized protein (DUF58 family)